MQEPKIQDFLNQIVTIVAPNGQLITNVLGTDGNGLFGFNGGPGFREDMVKSVFQIEVEPSKNLCRAVIKL